MTEINGKVITPTDTPLMTVSGLASYLSVSKSLIYKWVEEEKIPHYRFGKTVRFNPCQVKEWLESQRVQSPSSAVTEGSLERDIDKILRPTIIQSKI